MEPAIFTTSMDKYVTSVSWGTVILFLFLLALGLYLIYNSRKQEGYTKKMNRAGGIFLIVIILLPILSSLETYVKYYEVNDGGLTICRLVGNIQIPASEITDAQVLPENFKMKKSWGNNGMFGFSGEFTNPEVGRFNIYAKNTDKLVLVTTKTSGNVIIAPDDTQIVALLAK